MSDEDDKKAFGLVQPPMTIPDEPGIPQHGPMAGMNAAQRDAYMSQGRHDKTFADLPVIRIPNRADRDSRYVDTDEASSFGPPRPTPAEMEADHGRAEFEKHLEEAKQFGPPRPPARNEVSSDIVDRAVRKLAERVPQVSDDQKMQNDAYVMRAKLAAERFAAPRMMAMKQNIAQNVPGAEAAAHAIRKVVTQPTVRQPIQMQREFSNEEEKVAYLARLREAAARAKQ